MQLSNMLTYDTLVSDFCDINSDDYESILNNSVVMCAITYILMLLRYPGAVLVFSVKNI